MNFSPGTWRIVALSTSSPDVVVEFLEDKGWSEASRQFYPPGTRSYAYTQAGYGLDGFLVDGDQLASFLDALAKAQRARLVGEILEVSPL